MERCGLLYLASAVGGAIGNAMRHDGGPLMEAMPIAWGVITGLVGALVFLLVDDIRNLSSRH
jgi:hypothetical protein